MRSHPYKSLTISGKFYPEKKLMEFAKDQVSNKTIPTWEINLFAFILEWQAESPILKVKTSGSTGMAKWMDVEKEKMIKSAELTGQFFNLQKNNKTLLCLPVDFIAGEMMVVRAFVLGLDLIPVEPSGSPLNGVDGLFDFAAMTPMQVYNTLKLDIGYQKLNQVKNLIIGGGEVNQVLLNKIKKLKNNTYHTYGMTETLTHVAVRKLNGQSTDPNFKALPGIKFSVDDRECLIISAPHLANQQFITNDIVNLKSEKSFQFTGRYDNVLNSGGVKISPEIVENRLYPFIKKRFIVTGIPDDQLGEKVILIVEGNDNFSVDFTKIGLTKYEIPRNVYFLDNFPETESGKIIRQKVIQAALKKT